MHKILYYYISKECWIRMLNEISLLQKPWNIAIFFNNGESLNCLVLEMLTHLKTNRRLTEDQQKDWQKTSRWLTEDPTQILPRGLTLILSQCWPYHIYRHLVLLVFLPLSITNSKCKDNQQNCSWPKTQIYLSYWSLIALHQPVAWVQ